ncbi:MAG TPA: hypothetical protein VGN23_01805 [Verrucomicrobiae bacterium]
MKSARLTVLPEMSVALKTGRRLADLRFGQRHTGQAGNRQHRKGFFHRNSNSRFAGRNKARFPQDA